MNGETEWYVVDKRTNEIINCITTSGPRPDDALTRFVNGEHLRLDANPPLSMLERYQYWNERP